MQKSHADSRFLHLHRGRAGWKILVQPESWPSKPPNETSMRQSLALLTATLCVVGAFLALPDSARAAYPDRPVYLVVGYGAGGGTDLVARAIAPSLAKALGQPVIIENKPGAGGSAGAGYVARARADGYTVLLSSASSVTIMPAIDSKVGYSRRDFTPVTQLSIAPLVIAVNKNLGIHSIPELIAAARAAPGKLNFASSGLGSGPHLAGVLFNQVAGVKLVHVPYRSGAPATLSVISGETQLTFATTPSVMPQIRAGQLLGLAVSTHDGSSLVPELPGMVKAGLPNYEIFQWNGLFVPAGTPPEVVQALFAATRTAMQAPEVKHLLAIEGTDVSVSASPAAFDDFLKKDDPFWTRLVKDSGVTNIN
jgi:tripartite-type tricarboxylate transporter receptor subunit TctC